jgi:hypothetical protein
MGVASHWNGGRGSTGGTLPGVSDLEPRRSGRPSRKARADRAYSLVLVTGGLAVLTVALVVLAVVGVVGGGLAVLAAILAVISGLLLRRALR